MTSLPTSGFPSPQGRLTNRKQAGRPERGADRARPLAAYAISAGIWLLALAPTYGASEVVVNVAIFTSLGLLAVAVIARPTQDRHVASFLLLLLFLTSIFIGTVWSPFGERSDAFLSFARVAATILAFALAARRVGSSDRYHVVRALIALALFQAVLAVSQKLFGWPAVWGYLGDTSIAAVGVNTFWPDPIGRAVGTMAHPIPLAMFLGIAVILVASTRARRPRALNFVFIAVLITALLASGTRSALVALILSAIVAIFESRLLRKQPLLGIALLAGLAALALAAQPEEVSRLLNLSGSVSLTHRVDSWSIISGFLTLTSWSALVGFGWNPFEFLNAHALLQSTTLTAIDNSVASVIAVGGLIGLAAISLLFVLALIRGDAQLRVCLVFIGVMMLSFDVVLWLAPMVVLVVFTQFPPTTGRGRTSGVG